jgi:hypothetical protein
LPDHRNRRFSASLGRALDDLAKVRDCGTHIAFDGFLLRSAGIAFGPARIQGDDAIAVHDRIIFTDASIEESQLGAKENRCGWRPACAAGKRGVPAMIYPGGEHTAFTNYVRKFDSVSFIIDHVGMEVERAALPGQLETTIEQLLTYAKYPNVAIKWGHAPRLSRQPFPYRDVITQLRRVIGAKCKLEKQLSLSIVFSCRQCRDSVTERAAASEWPSLPSGGCNGTAHCDRYVCRGYPRIDGDPVKDPSSRAEK